MKKITILTAGMLCLSVARAELVGPGEHVGLTGDGAAVMCDASNDAWNVAIVQGGISTEARRDARGAVMKCLSTEAAKKKFGTPYLSYKQVQGMAEIIMARQNKDEEDRMLGARPLKQWDDTGLQFVSKDDACTATKDRLIFAVGSDTKLMICNGRTWTDAAPLLEQMKHMSDLVKTLPRYHGECIGIPVC
ncbi:TPA: hypothetical protein ACK3Q6_008057 [Burkholderia cepacia]